MKKLLVAIVFLFSFFAQSQIVDVVKWKTKLVQKSNTEFELVMDAQIEFGWHLYALNTPDGGSQPLVFTFKEAGKNYQLVGKTTQGAYKKEYSDVFEVDEYYFINTAQFKQLIKVTNPNLKEIKVYLEGQTCIDGKCIQEEENLTFKLPEIKVEETIVPKVDDKTNTENKNVNKLIEEDFDTNSETSETFIDSSKKDIDTITKSEGKIVIKKEKFVKPEEKKKGLWTIFILSFLGGLAALLTPCVFPMIPMTVSFFTKQSGTRAKGITNAIIYGLSIIVIYVLLGLLITGVFGADALNAISTSVLFNVVFFAILVFFATSFLGAFEIVLPNSWANKVDAQAGKSGIIAIFFMALALAIVSFSCTGPIVGTLLVEASSKGGIAPVIGMLGFSSAIALPFMLFALFPSWLNTLPKSGGWLNTVKVSLGFLELAFAFKFLSNADLVLQLHWLEREVFLAIWIAIFGAWAMYLFGKFMLPHDYDSNVKISVGRLYMAIFVSIFTIYLIPGLWGAPLKILSGFTPPLNYSESPFGIGNTSNGNTTSFSELPEHAHLGPHGIVAFDDYEYGLAYARKVNKPILLDFTGDACANCRKMEDFVWSSQEILPILKEEIVLISLYCDRKIELPKASQYVSKETGKEIVTIGNKWSDFQITRYKNNAQPLYVILDAEGNDISIPIGYTPNIQEYKTWLEEGIANFK